MADFRTATASIRRQTVRLFTALRSPHAVPAGQPTMLTVVWPLMREYRWHLLAATLMGGVHGIAITFQTVPEGDMVGISWLIPPYRRAYDARALDLVRAIGIDAKCLRDKCDKDHDFGYAMMMRFVPVLVERLQATRLQVLDVYGQPR